MDPWASPADQPKAATRAVHNAQTPAPPDGGTTAARPLVTSHGSALRTTSAFTTHGADADSDVGGNGGKAGGGAQQSSMGAGWGAMGNEGFSNGMPAGIEGAGFGAAGNGDGDPSRIGRGGGGTRATSQGAQEVVMVTVLPEKEGMFMFQHRNYEVKSARRGSAVIRRYSDFVWLLDCLHKRYPFRQLPLLPPKTLARKSTGRCGEDRAHRCSSERPPLVSGYRLHREAPARPRAFRERAGAASGAARGAAGHDVPDRAHGTTTLRSAPLATTR